MESFIKERLKSFGIPIIEMNRDSIKGYSVKYSKSFLNDRKNMVVIGEQHYEKCARLMTLALLRDLSLDLIWINQSMLKNLDFDNCKYDIAALVSLYEEPSDVWKGLAGSFINKVILNCGQVLLGCESMSTLQAVFPYDLDRIEKEFVVWIGE